MPEHDQMGILELGLIRRALAAYITPDTERMGERESRLVTILWNEESSHNGKYGRGRVERLGRTMSLAPRYEA